MFSAKALGVTAIWHVTAYLLGTSPTKVTSTQAHSPQYCLFVLNLLIAVMIEVYADSASRSGRLYGRTRTCCVVDKESFAQGAIKGRNGWLSGANLHVFILCCSLSHNTFSFLRGLGRFGLLRLRKTHS